MRKIILASASRWRRDILEKSGLPFVVEVSNYEEDLNLRVPPVELVEILAEGKADAVAASHRDAIVISADTVADLDGQVIGKPYTPEKAIEVLARLSGRTHDVHTGYCIIDTRSGQKVTGTDTTRVTFRDLSREEIETYVATKEPLDAAGSYTIQGRAAGFVSRIEGDFYSIVGLSLATIVEKLKQFELI